MRNCIALGLFFCRKRGWSNVEPLFGTALINSARYLWAQKRPRWFRMEMEQWWWKTRRRRRRKEKGEQQQGAEKDEWHRLYFCKKKKKKHTSKASIHQQKWLYMLFMQSGLMHSQQPKWISWLASNLKKKKCSVPRETNTISDWILLHHDEKKQVMYL